MKNSKPAEKLAAIEAQFSDLERELLEFLKERNHTLVELRDLNPKFIGALGKLKSWGLVEIMNLPNKEKVVRFKGIQSLILKRKF